MAVRTGSSAVAWAARQVTNPSRNWHNLCLMFVRICFNVGSKYPTAERAFYATRYRHGTGSTPPAGVPVWWTNGRYGHIAISAGRGYCYSTDIKRRGRVNKVPISYITRAWGQRYRGWTEDINGVRVWRPKAPVPPPRVDLSNVVDAARRDRTRPQGQGLHERDVLIVERALVKEGLLASRYAADGYAGTTFRTAYAKWQRRSGSGGPYDGIPGLRSLQKLGGKYRFWVGR